MALLEVESALDDADSTGVTQHILRPLTCLCAASEVMGITTPRTIRTMERSIMASLDLGSTVSILLSVAISYP